MARTSIPTLNLQDYLSGDEQRKSHFIQALGDALTDIGFFALTGHGIDLSNIQNAYRTAKDFFSSPMSSRRSTKKNKELKNVDLSHLE